MRQKKYLPTWGLQVDEGLRRFVDEEVLPGTRVDSAQFWSGLDELVQGFAARNRELLAVRETLQDAIDQWHRDRRGQPHDDDAYKAFLIDIGYVGPEPDPLPIDPPRMDAEIARVAGPQLVVPVSNARYAINAVNARWGSLYDALYGSDAMGDSPPVGAYDEERGRRVIDRTRAFLDDVLPLDRGSHQRANGYSIGESDVVVAQLDGTEAGLRDPGALVGYTGSRVAPESILFRHHGLAVELVFDRHSPVGRSDPAGIEDVVLEAAISVIIDLEDSVAAVDSEDKVAAYRNWLGLMRGTLEAPVAKGGSEFIRTMNPDRRYRDPTGGELILPGRGLMMVRNVGLLMTTDLVLDDNGDEIPEGILDGLVTAACALHDLDGLGRLRNSAAGSIYIVKPKLHGPEEASFTNELFDKLEEVLNLQPNTIKIGVMDEERRTSVNLAACIDAVRSRIAFINTGFLDRTGDEIHTSMEAGPMVRKADMKHQRWIRAYEDRNVEIGLRFGFPGHAQIGKGMWAAPDLMAAMLDEKRSHPESGASCAWVPSPTAATLHATHYHYVDVAERQLQLTGTRATPVEPLLVIPMSSSGWSDQDRLAELENNAQGILGYVVRWIDQGVGCSKVPDISGVGLMEDRATCRISSQHIANWMLHGLTTVDEVTSVMQRMALLVDVQNSGDPAYSPMGPNFDGPAFEAALALVLDGASQPSGYTEPILSRYRQMAKSAAGRAV